MSASLSQTEAESRAGLVEVRSYAVELDLTRGAEVFGSTTVIRFGCAGPETFVELRPATLRRAVLNGQQLRTDDLTDGRLRLTGLVAENELRVEAEMPYTRTGEGMHRFTDPADGEVYVYTQCGPDHSSQVFACFDQPDLKAPVTVSVTSPDDWVVLSNAAGEQVSTGSWTFRPTAPISTYLVAVAGGPLHAVRSTHDGIPLGLYARRSLAPYLDAEAEEILDVTRRSFDRYHELFDERYPFGKYDQVFVPEFNWGAVENPGCVTFRDEYLFRSAVTDTQRLFRAVVIAHELAHMWFGDLVTMRWWDDLWLNESFAEYMGYEVVAATTRYTEAWTAFAATRKPWGYDADERTSTHPIAAQRIEDAAAAMANFDGISYAKGASALRQLVAWLGEREFIAGVNDHFAAHRFGNAGLDDLVEALTRAGGRDVGGWTRSWLRTTGIDTLRAELDDAGGRVTSARITGATRPHRVRVGVYDLDEARHLALRERFEADLAPSGGTELPRLAGEPRPDLVVINDGDLSYAKVRLDDRSWQTVSGALSSIDDELTRAVLWNTARDMVRDADLPAADFLALAEAHLPAEPVVLIVEAVLAFGRRQIADRYLDPAQRAAALAVFAGVCRHLLRHTEDAPGLRLAAVRGLVDCSATDEEVAELAEWLRSGQVPGGPALDPELRWAILLQLVSRGAAGEDAIAAELAADTSATGQESAARCRAALPDRSVKEHSWRQLFTDGELSRPLLTATADGFWQPGQTNLTAGFVERYFDQVPSAGERGPAVAGALGTRLFPVLSVTAETVQLAEKCLARDDLDPLLRRALTDETDDLRRALRIRSA